MSMNYAPSMFWGAQSFDPHQLAVCKLGGDDESRRRARKYIDLVRAQRVGPVHVDESSNDGDWVQLWLAGWGVATLKSTHLAIKRKIVANSHQ